MEKQALLSPALRFDFQVHEDTSALQAWELFFLVASVMPPSKEFVSLVSEYVHTVAHPEGPAAAQEVQQLTGKTWTALKRSAKAGPRRTVSALAYCTGLLNRTHC